MTMWAICHKNSHGKLLAILKRKVYYYYYVVLSFVSVFVILPNILLILIFLICCLYEWRYVHGYKVFSLHILSYNVVMESI